MKVKKLIVQDLHILTSLFDYNDVEQMIVECTQDMENEILDIFALYNETVLIGELHVMYTNDDKNVAVKGRRAYLFAFRIHKDFQGKGYGKYLLRTVLELLEGDGYYEFTIGVEDDNSRALHIYQSLGFNKLVMRKQEAYQGNKYEYNLYLKR